MTDQTQDTQYNPDSAWELEPERPRLGFGQCQFKAETLTSKKGNQYEQFFVTLYPLDIARPPMTLGKGDRGMSQYDLAWKSVILPSLHKLTRAGKLASPQQIRGDHFVSWQWVTYRDYDKETIAYYAQNNPAKLETDQNGKQFKPRRTIEILDVYPDQATCQAAADAWFFQDNTPPVNGQAPPVADPQRAAALEMLPLIIEGCEGDLLRLESELSDPGFSKFGLTINAPEVQALLKERGLISA